MTLIRSKIYGLFSKTRLIARPPTRDVMAQAIQEEWDVLRPAEFQRALDSMPRRCQMVIEAKGGAISYY